MFIYNHSFFLFLSDTLLVFLFFLWIQAIECYSNLTTSTISTNEQVKHPPVEITRDHSIIRTSDFWHIHPFSSLLSPTEKFTSPSMKNPTLNSDPPTSNYATSGTSPSDQNVQDRPQGDLTKILSTPTLETSVSTVASSILTTIQWIEQLNKTINSISERPNYPSRDPKSLSFSRSTLVSILVNTTQKPTHNVSNMQTPHPATTTGKWPNVENSTKKVKPSINPEVYKLTVTATATGNTSDVAKITTAATETLPPPPAKHSSSSSASKTTTDTTMALNITPTHNSSNQVVILSHNMSQVSVTNPNPGSILDSFTTSGTPSTGAERHVIANSSRTLSTLTTLSSDGASVSSNYTSDTISGNHPADTFLTTPQIIGISFGTAVVILGISKYLFFLLFCSLKSTIQTLPFFQYESVRIKDKILRVSAQKLYFPYI